VKVSYILTTSSYFHKLEFYIFDTGSPHCHFNTSVTIAVKLDTIAVKLDAHDMCPTHFLSTCVRFRDVTSFTDATGMVCNNYRLWLCSRLFEESPAWFCSHLLAMIQACTNIQQ